jgi:fumarate reductase iron-sulfur subunit
MPESESHIEVSVWRGGENGTFVSYQVPIYASLTVLDVVSWIQRNLDPTLAYRFSCRVGVCGSCAMTVNGRPRWTCRTHISAVIKNSVVEIAPLENLPVIKDLAVDMRVFFEKWQSAKGVFAPTLTRQDEVAAVKPDSEARVAVDKAIECINCGICYAACDTVRWNADYLGPAQLNRAWTLVNDERDGKNRERLQSVAAKGGCHSCHSHQSCQEYCPASLNPTASISGLKRRTAQAMLRGEM